MQCFCIHTFADCRVGHWTVIATVRIWRNHPTLSFNARQLSCPIIEVSCLVPCPTHQQTGTHCLILSSDSGHSTSIFALHWVTIFELEWRNHDGSTREDDTPFFESFSSFLGLIFVHQSVNEKQVRSASACDVCLKVVFIFLLPSLPGT